MRASSQIRPFALMILLNLLAWPFFSFANKDARMVKKVGRRFEKIHATDYAYSLRKISDSEAAEKFYTEIKKIEKIYHSISDTAAIQIPLKSFLDKWHTLEVIHDSILNGDQKFMADVTAFYLQGLVRRREGTKTLFPAYKA